MERQHDCQCPLERVRIDSGRAGEVHQARFKLDPRNSRNRMRPTHLELAVSSTLDQLAGKLLGRPLVQCEKPLQISPAADLVDDE